MREAPVFLAVLVQESGARWWHTLDESVREALITSGALLVLVGLLLVWALYFRKRRRHRSRPHSHRAQPQAMAQAGEAPGSDGPSPRRRRRRRAHRPRNPTLAETGGLPPIRTQEPPQASL